MIDTHSHILPSIDDGARDLAQSIEFIKTARCQGVKTIFATPHARDGVYNCEKEDILEKCSRLNKVLMDENISMRILPGSEVRVTHDLVAAYDKGRLLTLNNSGAWLLIELPGIFIKDAITMIIKQLMDRGVTPIIAHAERNAMILNRPEIINEFLNCGALIQITASSLTNDFGRPAMKAAQAMLAMDQVFCMGSDIHPGRKYRMADAKKRLVKIVGQTKADRIVRDNPCTILKHRTVSYKKEYL